MDGLLDALRRAVGAAPDDVVLRLHLARVLLEHGERDEAIREAGGALQRDPANTEARALMLEAMAPATARSETAPPESTAESASERSADFDWGAAEEQLDVSVDPPFVAHDGEPVPAPVERPTVTLADVGGMEGVKARLTAAFLAPMRNPELRAVYGKQLRGGLLLYGPPGCGKTFLGRALASELEAGFVSITLADVLDPLVGVSERNVHAAFDLARRSAPCVLFIDEIDALGARRSVNSAWLRGATNQLLMELDGVDASNEGVFVLAATNQPWQVDPALRRPGRLDRTVLVLPPDQPAREAILTHELASRPVTGIDVRVLAKRTEGYSGADLAHVCETAAEAALMDSVASGTVRFIGMRDLEAAVAEVRPSTGPWLDSARNMVEFGEDDGTYRELKAYLRKGRRTA